MASGFMKAQQERIDDFITVGLMEVSESMHDALEKMRAALDESAANPKEEK